MTSLKSQNYSPQLQLHKEAFIPASLTRQPTGSSPRASHFTVQSQNENQKQKRVKNKIERKEFKASCENNGKALTSQDRKYKRLCKQAHKVKTLQERYRQMQEDLAQIKVAVGLQLQLITYSFNQSTQQQSTKQHSQLNQSQHKQPLFHSIDVKNLNQLIQTLFTYHSTIQIANSNYLLLSQVNKQQQSQKLFQINELQQRIRQLRFLLNSKEDLLAYEMVTSQKNNNQAQALSQQCQEQTNNIKINFNMPRKQIVNRKNVIDDELKFVQSAVREMNILKREVGQLEIKLKRMDSCIKENQSDKKECQTERHNNKDQDNIKIRKFQVNKDLAPQKITPLFLKLNSLTKNKPMESSDEQAAQKLTLLPSSVTNYKQSLIYRVGKLHGIQKLKQAQLKQKYTKLVRQYNQQVSQKAKLVDEYQFKRDVYRVKAMKARESEQKKEVKTKDTIKKSQQDKYRHGTVLQQLQELQQATQGKVRNTQVQEKGNHRLVSDPAFKVVQELPGLAQKLRSEPIPQTPKLYSSIVCVTASLSPTEPKITPTPSYQPTQFMLNNIINQAKNERSKLNDSPFLKVKKTQQVINKHFSLKEKCDIIRQRRKLVQSDDLVSNTYNKQNLSGKQYSAIQMNLQTTQKTIQSSLTQPNLNSNQVENEIKLKNQHSCLKTSQLKSLQQEINSLTKQIKQIKKLEQPCAQSKGVQKIYNKKQVDDFGYVFNDKNQNIKRRKMGKRIEKQDKKLDLD